MWLRTGDAGVPVNPGMQRIAPPSESKTSRCKVARSPVHSAGAGVPSGGISGPAARPQPRARSAGRGTTRGLPRPTPPCRRTLEAPPGRRSAAAQPVPSAPPSAPSLPAPRQLWAGSAAAAAAAASSSAAVRPLRDASFPLNMAAGAGRR